MVQSAHFSAAIMKIPIKGNCFKKGNNLYHGGYPKSPQITSVDDLWLGCGRCTLLFYNCSAIPHIWSIVQCNTTMQLSLESTQNGLPFYTKHYEALNSFVKTLKYV